MPDPIRIATRQSPLALWQANEVLDRMSQLDAEAKIELLPMTTKADRWLETPLSKIGGKGLFVKELEQSLYDKRADLAVHSMKDVTAVTPEGLIISTVLSREDPFDAFVSNRYASLEELPKGAIIGTCSPRRMSQLRAYDPSIQTMNLRGNVNTRLAKLDSGEYDAIILACAGLKRLGFEDRIRHALATSICLPAVGQGIIGIETRTEDTALRARLQALHDEDAAARLTAERALSARLNGGCSAPIAGFATLEGDTLHMTARVIALMGNTVLEVSGTAPRGDAQLLGQSLAEQLIDQGAQALLDEAEAITAAEIAADGTPAP